MTFFRWWQNLVQMVELNTWSWRRWRKHRGRRKTERRRCWLSVEPFEERLTPSSTGEMFVAVRPFHAFQFQTVPVSVGLAAIGAATLGEFDIAMSYDPTQLFVATTVSNEQAVAFKEPLSPGFTYAGNIVPNNTLLPGLVGTIAVDAFSFTGLDNSDQTIDLLDIAFTNLQSAGHSIINLRASVPLSLNQSLPTKAYGISSGDVYTLDPPPNDTAGDVVDGTLIVLTPGTIASTTTVTSSGPTAFGEPVTITATVQGGASNTIDGGVMFMDGATTLGFANVTDDGSGTGRGIATFTTSSLAAGTHSLTATYGGGTNYAASSTTGTFLQTVNQASTTTTVTAATPSSPVYGSTVTFMATVHSSPTGATGTVTFSDGGSSIGTSSISGTTATFSTTALSIGTHTITASYGGDTNFSASPASGTFLQTVTGGTATTTVTSSSSTSILGDVVTFSATVTGNQSETPSGTVTFSDGSTSLGQSTLSGSGAIATASFPISTLSAGTHTVTASYGGDSTYCVSSGSTVQTVNQASTTTTVNSSTNPLVFGQGVTFTATCSGQWSVVSGQWPTGIVTFQDGGTSVGTGAVSGGVAATFATSMFTVGVHTITATYGGDGNFTASTSDTLTQTVNPASTTTTVTSSASPSVFGQSVSFTATVSVTSPGAGTPTGTVMFEDGGFPLSNGMVTLDSNGTATFMTSSLTAGYHTITAVYGGDGNCVSSSGSFVQMVSQAQFYTVTNTSNDNTVIGSLPYALAQADNNTSSGPFTIFFDPVIFATPQTIAPAGVLNLNNSTLGASIIIAGPTAALTIQGGGHGWNSSVFMVAANTTATLENLTISNGSTPGAGGGILNNGTLTVSNCSLSDNSASYGGGIYNSGMLWVSNTTLSGNSASYGGGIYNSGMLWVSNTTLSGNSASYGGGICNYGTVTVSNTTLSSNSAYYNGGGIYNNGGPVTVSNCMFSGNSASNGNGGGIYNNSPLTVSTCTLSGNSAYSGGGIYNNSGPVTVSTCTLSGNSAFNGDGGGIDMANWNTLTVSNCILSGNSASNGGNGGGICNYGPLTVSNCTLSGNSAYPNYWGGGGGGGIFSYGGPVTVSNCILSGNSAQSSGGGIDVGNYWNWSTLTVSTCTLSGNSAQGSGGGIYNRNGPVTVSTCTLSGNSAQGSGGGICNDLGGTVMVSNSTLYGNAAHGYGGGIYNNGTGAVSNCTLADNSAVWDGGGIFNAAGTVTVSNSTLAGNSAAYGGGIGNSDTVTLLSTIVAGNTVTISDPDIAGSVTSNSAYNLIGDSTGLAGISNGDGNHNQVGVTGSDPNPIDPLLGPLANNGGPTATMALLPGSPAIGAGAKRPHDRPVRPCSVKQPSRHRRLSDTGLHRHQYQQRQHGARQPALRGRTGGQRHQGGTLHHQLRCNGFRHSADDRAGRHAKPRQQHARRFGPHCRPGSCSDHPGRR